MPHHDAVAQVPTQRIGGEELLRRVRSRTRDESRFTSGTDLLAFVRRGTTPAKERVPVSVRTDVSPDLAADVTAVAEPGIRPEHIQELVEGGREFNRELGLLDTPSPAAPRSVYELTESAADVLAVPLGRRPAPTPTIRAATPLEEMETRMVRARKADQEALQERFEKIPGPVRVALSGARGFADAATLGHIDELVNRANQMVASTLGVDAPKLTTDEVLDMVERSGLEKFAGGAGFVAGAGATIMTGNRLLAGLAPAAREGSRARSLLQAFDPSKPASVGIRALQGAVEGLPFDLAFDADSPGERARNVALGLVLGGLLGPAVGGRVRETDEAVEAGARRAPSPADDVAGDLRTGAPEELEDRVADVASTPTALEQVRRPEPAPPPGAGKVFSQTREAARDLPTDEIFARYQRALRQAFTEGPAAEAKGPGLRVFDEAGIKGVVGTGKGSFERGRLTQALHRVEALGRELESRGIEPPHPDDSFRGAALDDIPVALRDEYSRLSSLSDDEVVRRLADAERDALHNRGSSDASVRRVLYAGEARSRGLTGPITTEAEDRAVGVSSGVLFADPVNVRTALSARTSLEGRLRDQGVVATGKALEGPLPKIPSRASIVRDLSETLNVPVGIKRFRQRALGIFKIGPETIRLKVAGDIEVVAHEAGHFLQKALFGRTGPRGGLLNAPLRPWKAELEALAEGVSDESVSEGFAEFVRRYLTNVDAARSQAPSFFEFFEETLEHRMPQALAMLRRAREDYRVWREAPAQARVRAQIARPEDLKPELVAEEVWRKLRTAAVDDLTPLRHAVEEAKLDPGDVAADVATLADLARGSAGQAELMIENGMVDFDTRQLVGGSYKEVFDPLKNDAGQIDPEAYAKWADYAISRRAEYLYSTREDISFLGIERADAQRTIVELDSPEFRDTLERFQEYNDGLLDWLEGAGVISAEAREAIALSNEVYVPLMRAVDQGAPGTGGRKLTNRRNPIKRIRGSGRQILDPGEVTLERTYQYTRLAAKQEVSNAIFELAQREGMGYLIEEIPAPLKALKISTEEALEAIWKTSARPDEALDALPEEVAAEMLMFFRPGDYQGADNVISVLIDGRRKFYEVDPELFKALEGLDETDLSRWMNVLATPARTLRAGATLAPEFGPRNVMRDQLMAGVQSEYGFIPYWDMVQGMASLLKNDEFAVAFKAGGGARSTLISMDRASIRKNFITKLTRPPSAGRRVVNAILNPIDLLRAASEFFENSTRVGEVRLALKELRAQGVPEGEAVRRAAKAAREVTVDFGRSGTQTKQLRIMAAFWNARIQGYDRLFRAFKANPRRTTARAVALITLPSIGEYLLNRNDPEYFEIPQWQRDLFWLIKTPGGHWLRFPKPFELGIVFGTMPVRILEWMDGNDPEGFEIAAEEFLKEQTRGFAPVPTFLVPLIDNYANFNGFLGRPVVPRGLEGVDPEEQYTARTSEVSKQLGRWLNLSPAKIDNLLYSYTGGLGRLATQTIDLGVELAGKREPSSDVRPLAFRAPGLRGFTVRTPGRSSESIERLYRMRDRANQKKSTYDKMRREGRAEEAERYYEENEDWIVMRTRLNRTTDELSRLRAAIDEVRTDRALSKDARNDEIAELERLMTQLAAAALNRQELPNLEEPR